MTLKCDQVRQDHVPLSNMCLPLEKVRPEEELPNPAEAADAIDFI